MAHSGKTMTFATDLVPQENNIYNLGQENLKWIIRGSLPLSDITGADDLKAIEAISGTTGLLKKTAANTWTLDANSYVTSSGITSVTIGATSPVQSSTSTAQNGSSASTTISLKDAYGDTKNPYGSKTKNYVLAAPSNANGTPNFRALVAADIPTLAYVPATGGVNDVNTLVNTGIYNITSGSATNTPKGYGFGQLLVMSYRKHTGNTTTDWASQLYLHNGSGTASGNASAPGNVLYYRTSNSASNNTWFDWQKAVHVDDIYTKVGDTNKPVYIAADGTATPISYEINKSVPSDAIFTDHYAWSDITSKPDTATRWPKWNEIAAGADVLPEGTSNWTDNTEILTSYASNNGFADSASKGVVYRRDALCAYNYIKGKLDSVYAAKATTLSGYGITNAVQYNGIDNDIGSSATAVNAKAYWANNNKVPKGKVVFNYNSSGTEFTTLFSNNNNSYGSILRWGYQDAYIRILRAHPNQTTYNGWYTEDWEKISAGYADTAPWSGISNKPTTLSGYGITDAIKTVASTDNAIVRFDGANGQVQKSGIIINDNDHLIAPSIRIANTYYGISFGRTTRTPVETILHTGIKWVSGSHMPVIHITGYAYGLQSPVEFKIGFYIYGNKIGWSGATNMGSWEPDIYLFKDTRDETNYVAVGLAGSCYFLQLSADLQDEMGKFNNVVSTDWSWDFLTTTGTIPSADDGTTCVKVSYRASIFGAKYANITSTTNAVAYYTDTAGKFGSKASANGALYATSANGALQWGTLPIAQGGTGKTNAADAWTALGGGASGKHADSYFALASHTHAASDINSGTLDLARIPTITNAKLANSKVTIAGNDVSLGGSLSDSTLRESLGLSKALRFVGVTTTDMTGGTATNHSWTGTPAGISNYTPKQGDVVINSTKQDEWVCTSVSGTTYTWERLGSDTSYKIVQSAVSDPTASTTTSTTFIDTISQNTNGVITATKKTLPTASSTVAGITKVGASGGAAAYNHTHTISLTQTGTSTINLTANTVYTLTAGGNSVVFKTPADQNTDTKVTQAYSTTDAAYPILMTATAGNTSTASRGDTTAILNNSIYANPNTGQLNATSYKINEAVMLQYNPGDSSLEFIFA